MILELGITRTPDTAPRIDFLTRLPEVKLPMSEDYIGLHGLGIETLEYAINHGVIPGMTLNRVKNPNGRKGDLNFFPRKTAFPTHALSNEFRDDSEAYKEAVIYANGLGAKRYFMKVLGWDFTSESDDFTAMNLTENELDEAVSVHKELIANLKAKDGEHDWILSPVRWDRFFRREIIRPVRRLRRKGYSEDFIQGLIHQALSRKGFVVGLDKSILDKFKVEPGDRDHGDLKINCPDGLDIKFINSITPCGPVEKEFLKELSSPLQ